MGHTLTAGRAAEQLVEDRVRAALPQADGYRVFANVAWTGPSTPHGPLTDGEADLVIVCDSSRRFKGLERPVIVLCELDPADKNHERLLYVGASRAKQHLIVIAGTRA
ncbi:MAG: ATP-binding domain-containing protein [Candidatus Limnocylindrales bacterium]